MSPAETALRVYARRTKRRIARENYRNPNVGEWARHRIQWRHSSGYRITVHAAETRLECELRMPDGVLAFAWQAPDKVCAMRYPLAAAGLSGFYVAAGSRHEEVAAWLQEGTGLSLLAALCLHPDESLQVYHNGIVAVARPTHDLATLLDGLVRLADHLPRSVSPESVSEVDLPAELVALAPYLSQWALSDDEARARKWQRASAARAAVVAEVTHRLSAINAYLDSFGDRPLPEVAQRLGALAEAVAELRVR